ncbi:MAG: hypothetical protein ABI851_12100 [Saprospiraceae bacterium]
MSEKRIYPAGITAFKPHVNAPEFVLAEIIITPRDLVDWIKENPEHLKDYKDKKQIRLQLTKWEEKLSISINTLVAKPKEEAASKPEQKQPSYQSFQGDKPFQEDLPF